MAVGCHYSIKFQNILGMQAFVTLSAKSSLILGENKAGFRRESHIYLVKLLILSNRLVQNIYISSVLKVRSQFAVRFMEFHEKKALHETPFSSEHIMRTINKSV